MKLKFIHALYVLPMLWVLSACHQEPSDLEPIELRCEYLENPVGIDAQNPRLSWKLSAQGRSRSQSAYQILVASSEELLAEDIGDLWDSEKTASDRSFYLPYEGRALSSGQHCFWKVKTWDQDDVASKWSEASLWTMALLNEEDWKAQWIGFDEAVGDTNYKAKPWGNNITKRWEYIPLPCPYFRKEFTLDEPIDQALIHITSLGIYQLYVNGVKVGNDFFTPGWTDYKKRIYYNTYDLKALLQTGKNTIAVILADGWYAGTMATRGQHFYGDRLRLKAQLNARFADGSTAFIPTDDTWKASYGPLQEADFHAGETYDARLEMDGWDRNDFDDGDWKSVIASDTQTAVLEAYPMVTVQQIERIEPAHVFKSDSGVYLVDMGQNFTGWAKLKVQGEAGDSVVMRFAEMLNADSSLHTRNLRAARCTDTYVLRGDGPETWEPRFTFHGYRFIEVSGYPGALTKDDITGIVLHSNLERTGHFSCSNDLINQIYHNLTWSQRSNYLEVPMDCPQRDERLGWGGDAHIFMRTGSYNMDISAFFHKWLVDLADAQMKDKSIPSTAPLVYNRVASGWGDAIVLCPWMFFEIYNDTSILEKFYPTMEDWMYYLDSFSSEYISRQLSFGDWQNVDSETPLDVLATSFYKHDAELVAQIASVLGKPEDAQKYQALADSIFVAFNDSLVDDSGRVKGQTQTAYLLALSFDMLPDSRRELAIQHLLDDIEQRGPALTTGIQGIKMLLPVLSEIGRSDLAYQLLMKRDFPSWGYHIDNGATTIWERWDGYSADSGFHEDITNSFNQYAFGAVGEWMFSTIAGIDQAERGYKSIIIRPQPGGDLSSAEATYNSPRGMISSSWKIDEGQFYLDVVIPPNTDAFVFIPTTDAESITEGGMKLDSVEGILNAMKVDDGFGIRIGSGRYRFRARY